MHYNKNKAGFTLIELLVVIAIIGILSALGLTYMSRSQTKARDAKRRSDLQSMGTSLSVFLDQHSNYPTADPTLLSGDPKLGPVWFGQTTNSDFYTQMVSANVTIPKSPQMGTSGTTKDYWYVTDPVPANFALFTQMESSGEWYVFNSKGWADTLDNSDAITAIPDMTNTECIEANPTRTFSVCLTEPLIQ